MNERPSTADRDRLLADAYHEVWTSGPASSPAAQAARSVRRRRALRRLASTAAAIALFASGAWWFALPPRPTDRMAAANPGYEIISDTELMSCLRDQSVMVLTDTDGQKKVIWLDDQEPAATEAPSA
jgi:hypothetical protein